MQKFEYRTPRFAVNIPALFKVETGMLSGRCRELSNDGMTIELLQEIEANISGVVTLVQQDQKIDIPAKVAHVDGKRAGLQFVNLSRAEQDAVARLITALTTPPAQSGPILLR